MKKSRILKSIFIIAYVLLVCVTVSFAWILSIKPNIVENVEIDYKDKGTLVIAPSDIEGAVYVTDETGTEVELTEEFHVSSNEVLPNSVIPFKIRLKNNTTNVAKVDLSIVGIETSKESLLGVVFFSATPTTGWTTYVPTSAYKQLGDAKKGTVSNTYSLTFMDNLTLRSTDAKNENDYLELSCYLFFDGESMTNEYQNIDLTIGAFRITQR